MDKCLMLVLMFCLKNGETGGHGDKHHNHLKIHLPEFIHHDHHTKSVTIHHHHHKPHIPKGHHYHHHHKKAHSFTKTSTKEHHGHHDDLLGHHSSDHGHGYHHDPVSYDQSVPSSFDSYGSYTNSPSPQLLQPESNSYAGVIPDVGASRNHGYEVTEHDEGENGLNSGNSVQQNFPPNYAYVRGVAEQPYHVPVAGLPHLGSAQSNSHDSYPGVIAPQAISQTRSETFEGIGQSEPFASAGLSSYGHLSFQPSQAYPVNFQGDTGFDEHSTSSIGETGYSE